MKRLIVGAVALALLIAACTGAAHLKALQPPAVPSSPPIRIPAAAQPRMQRGIDIDMYTYPGQDIAAAARADVAYIRRLHANAVSVSFPFFMAGPQASAVYATGQTPTPAQLAVLLRDAHRAGLYVSVRPLLDEANLGRSRVGWRPAHPRAWFASYRRFLLPYAAVAQRQHVAEFFVGAEFTGFGTSPLWRGLDQALRSRFHGALAYADNWSTHDFAGNGGPVRETVDAYHPQMPPFLTGWKAYDRSLPHGMVESEVGIDAVRGAFLDPSRHQWNVASLDQQVQARWFRAACHAAVAAHLGGIYFWPLGFSAQTGNGPTLTYQGLWSGGAGARAISACFAWMQRTGR